MRILWLSTGTINCEPIIGSLTAISKPYWQIDIHNYFTNGWCFTFDQDYDVILYISVSAGPHLPRLTNLLPFKAFTKKFVHICFDAACTDWHPLLEYYKKENIFDITVNIDGNDEWPSGPNDITTLAPIDPRPFEVFKKTIDCGFCGGWESPGRKEIIGYLKDQNLIQVRSRIESYFTYAEYAKFMCQCKKIINVDQSGGGSKQVKARVIETGLASALLYEPKGSITAKWFVPGFHYIEYETKEHLVELIKRRQDEYGFDHGKILHETITTKYNPTNFWNKIIGM